MNIVLLKKGNLFIGMGILLVMALLKNPHDETEYQRVRDELRNMCASYKVGTRERVLLEEALVQLVNLHNHAFSSAVSGAPNLLAKDTDTIPVAADRRSNDAYKHAFVAVLDIDDFKLFNSRFGDKVGDGVIRMVYHILEKSVRKNIDRVYNPHGEEFTIDIYTQTEMMAVQVLNRCRLQVMESSKRAIRKVIEKLEVTVHGWHAIVPDDICVTISAGMTYCGEVQRDEDGKPIIKERNKIITQAHEQIADLNMRLAKAAGKKRLCYWDGKTDDPIYINPAPKLGLRCPLFRLMHYKGAKLGDIEAFMNSARLGRIDDAEMIDYVLSGKSDK